MQTDMALLRKIPKADELLRSPRLEALSVPHTVLLRALHEELAELRAAFKDEIISDIPSTEQLLLNIENRALKLNSVSLCRVINATGVVLHTNLGRAPLCSAAVQAVKDVAENYSSLEYDLTDGCRGNREGHVEPLLCELSGASAALVVNNNAAAVLLVLSTLAVKKEVLLSRGELVEIGDSFRIPDIIRQSGAKLAEVGTTNKTHLSDYEDAITPKTALLLKVHTSNYRVVGFTSEVTLSELAMLGKKQGLPVVYDIGSGAILLSTDSPLDGEPTVPFALQQGADIVMFSGDKLLGGPQAGIILGNAVMIGKMKKNPLFRALRPDKMTLAALEATLRLYREPLAAKKEIPVLRMLCQSKDELYEKAKLLKELLDNEAEAAYEITLRAGESKAGGGAAPGKLLPTWLVAIGGGRKTAKELERCLRLGSPPIISRVADDALLLDVSTLLQGQLEKVAQGVTKIL
ncbi:MAG: L-seryl-tRNA(Sec) selenium transferase [Hydrogenoanaerobacterium sp.]